jgi:hypothetical protein
MKLFAAIVLGTLFALPVCAAEFHALTNQPPVPPAPETNLDTPCTSTQGAVIDGSLGLQGPEGTFGCCLPGNPGEPGNLNGFAMTLSSCQDGWVVTTNVMFNVADGGEVYHLYLWRDLGGIPYDACGLECAYACDKVIGAAGPTWESHDWTGAGCPCVTFSQELLYVGVTYVTISTPPDFYVGREDSPGHIGMAYGNLSGNHGDWTDLNDFGYGNLWGVENIIDTECGGVPVESSNWGSVKALYR